MTIKHTCFAAALFAPSLSTPSFAQEAGQTALPEICIAEEGKAAAAAMPAIPMNHEMDAAHSALMMGMEQTHKDMMTGAMAKDVDVAFYCGMIPHHQDAINMARAELEHGDNEEAKAMAQKVIDAQEKEIAEMVACLKNKPSN